MLVFRIFEEVERNCTTDFRIAKMLKFSVQGIAICYLTACARVCRKWQITDRPNAGFAVVTIGAYDLVVVKENDFADLPRESVVPLRKRWFGNQALQDLAPCSIDQDQLRETFYTCVVVHLVRGAIAQKQLHSRSVTEGHRNARTRCIEAIKRLVADFRFEHSLGTRPTQQLSDATPPVEVSRDIFQIVEIPATGPFPQ